MDDLHRGWIKTKLPEIANIIMGQSPPSSTYNTKGEGLPFFQGKAEFGSLYPKEIKYCVKPQKIAEAGDILISVRAPVGPTNLCKEKSCIGRGLATLCARKTTISKYLLYYFRNIESWLSSQGTGSTFTAISKSDLEDIDVLLAPLPEQRRIVAKLEKLLASVEACQERLNKIPALLKRFRQSVLAAACSGRLTNDWRTKKPSVENVAATIDAIRRRREAEAKTGSQKEKLREIFEILEENDSSTLPDGWRFVTLSKLCNSLDYGTSAKSHPSGKVPVLRMGNIQSGKIDWTDLVYTSDDNEIQKYILRPNTVLFNRTNSPELVGKTTIYRGERPAIFAGYLIRANQLPELEPNYLNLCLNTNYAKEFCLRVKTDGVSQSNINAQKLGAFEVPFCPLSEQHEIIRRVEALFKISEQIEERYQKAKASIDKLTQSILAKAFRGELVPQDPNDEPADELLRKIGERQEMIFSSGKLFRKKKGS